MAPGPPLLPLLMHMRTCGLAGVGVGGSEGGKVLSLDAFSPDENPVSHLPCCFLIKWGENKAVSGQIWLDP